MAHILATDDQIKLLTSAKTWYVDATFHVVRSPFYQLYTIHVFVRSEDAMKQLPVILCIMSRRRKKDYIYILTAIKEMLPSEPRVKRIVMDFEKALWRAADSVFSAVQIKGCAFHFSQALFRKIQELGLQPLYRSDEGTHKLLRKFMALCFIPQQHIVGIFQQLKAAATTAPLLHFAEYIEKTWINSSSCTPTSWSVYGQSVRTNNDVEGWHNRLKVKGKAQMNFYLMVNLLHNEATLVTTQIRLVSEGKLKRYQQKTYKRMQAKIFNLWEEYENGDRSAQQLLRAVSRLYGPKE